MIFQNAIYPTMTPNVSNMMGNVVQMQNIMNLGNSGACSSSPSYCQEGYSIYVPCIKNITRGQNVCFQFYIADKTNQDTLDLNHLCGLTLDLSGPFNCPYKSYTFPDDIKSLQREEFSEKKCQSFDGNIFRLDIGYLEYNGNSITEIDSEQINDSDFNVNVTGKYGDFCEGETPYLYAEDSTTHIFVGWTTDERISDLCENFSIDDLIVSDENEWIWDEPINRDITIYAVYRKRKTYRVKVSFENRHSFFMIYYNGNKYMLSDKERDYVDVMEGYHFIAKCCPVKIKDKDLIVTHTYIFYKWSDGVLKDEREYFVSDKLFKNGELKLLAKCSDTKVSKEEDYNISIKINPTEDLFYINLPEENKLGYTEIPYDSENIECAHVYQVYDPKSKNHSYITLKKEGYIEFDSNSDGGYLRLILNIDTSNLFEEINKDAMYHPPMVGPGLMDEPEIIKPEIVGEITVRNGEKSFTISIDSREDKELIFDFENCENGLFEITSTCADLHIDKICVFEKLIIDKGLMELCIPAEDTSKFYRGILNMSGAICVDDNWSGLETVQIGMINNLAPIEIRY